MVVRIDARLLQRGMRDMTKNIPGVGQRAGKNTGEVSASKMVSRVHVQTGELRASIDVKTNTPVLTRVGASADHAFIEASKGGDHDFFFPELVFLEEGGWVNNFVEEFKRSV